MTSSKLKQRRSEASPGISKVFRIKKAGQFKESIENFKKAAQRGHARAQVGVGMGYVMGRGVEQDASKAAYWWGLSAMQGNRVAQNNLGVLYRKGQGVPQDYAEALRLCSESAMQDYPMGQYSLGILYKEGLGVVKDEIEAYAWWALAANNDNKKAQNALTAVVDELKQDRQKMEQINARMELLKVKIGLASD